MSTKVRLVRCPKCRELLAELPNVSLYQCGGCGTVLQAKIRKGEGNRAEPSQQEACSVSNNQQATILEAGNSSCDLTRPPSVESLTDKDYLSIQNKFEKCIPKLPEVQNNRLLELVEQNGESRLDQVKGGESQIGRLEDDDFIDEVQNLPELEDVLNVVSSDVNHDNANGLSRALPIPIQLSSTDQKADSQEGNVLVRRIRSLTSENNLITSDCDSVVGSGRFITRGLGSIYINGIDDEDLDRSPGNRTPYFGRISSMDTLGSTSPADLHFKCMSAANYRPAGSYYDGSESSYDGIDDQIRGPVPSRQSKDENYVAPMDMPRKGEFMVNIEPERIYWESSSSHRANKTAEPSRYSNDTTAGPSSYGRPRPFSSLEKPSYSALEKMNLLKRVNELKEQLNSMYFPKVGSNGRFPPRVAECEAYGGIYHQDLERGGAERCNSSRMDFSGQAARYRRQASSHCCTQEWRSRYSLQLPTNSTRCRNSCCVLQNDPWYDTSSDLSMWSEVKSENMRHDEIRRLRSKEKYHKAKKYLRAVAGGAPVVACYHCSELLQLPADFLLFKKKFHRLKCDACSKILKFLLKKGTRIVPYIPDSPALSHSESDDSNNVSSCQHVEAVSYSDNGRSDSSEVGRNSRMEDRKMKSVMMEDYHDKNGIESTGVDGSWRNGSSEIEEVLPSANSTLHRLMGYSSISQVLKK